MSAKKLRVYTGGTFDLFHAGHVELLRYCKLISEQGEVTVGLNTDEFVRNFKGKTPVCSYFERLEVLKACRHVDHVIRNFGGPDSKPAITIAQPNVIVIGSDWHPQTGRDYMAQMQFTQDWLDTRGITLQYYPRTTPISSTDIRARIQG